MASRGASDVLARAAVPMPAMVADEVDGYARGLLLVAAIESLECPEDQRPSHRLARAVVVGADVHRLTWLATGWPSEETHKMIERLAQLGAVTPEVAQEAHLRLDRPADQAGRHSKLRENSDPARVQPPGS